VEKTTDESQSQNVWDVGWFKIPKKKYEHSGQLMEDVDKFLTELGPARIISVCPIRSEHTLIQAVIVWYWEETDAQVQKG
jgi:hypothetical protein